MNEAQRLKRGDIWTVAGGKDYAGKPRPVVVQDDGFDACQLNQAVLPCLGLAVSPRTRREA
jgi:hypothetical protein